jgi:hypothetical protein
MSDDKKTITVREFRYWLQGVEEMQDEHWTPTSSQWAKIREKIDSITDVEPQSAPTPTPAPVRYAAPAMVPPMVQPPTTQPPTGPVSLAGPSSLAIPPRPTMSSNPLLAQGNSIPVRTPDIDTSGKGYESGFV